MNALNNTRFVDADRDLYHGKLPTTKKERWRNFALAVEVVAELATVATAVVGFATGQLDVGVAGTAAAMWVVPGLTALQWELSSQTDRHGR